MADHAAMEPNEALHMNSGADAWVGVALCGSAVNGPFRWRVAYRDIRSVTRRREFMAGPALSMDRLVIDDGPMRWLIISPRDPEAFQQALQQRLDCRNEG